MNDVCGKMKEEKGQLAVKRQCSCGCLERCISAIVRVRRAVLAVIMVNKKEVIIHHFLLPRITFYCFVRHFTDCSTTKRRPNRAHVRAHCQIKETLVVRHGVIALERTKW